MRFFCLVALCWAGVSAQALELQYLQQVTLPYKMKFKKTTIGGLSGLVYDPSTQVLSAVSDDRGHVNEPRLYQFRLTVGAKEFKVEPREVIKLSVNRSELSHQSTRSKAELFSRVLDLEGVALTPWGDFLLVNEGDMNKKPRVPPQILDVKPDGTIVREFDVPEAFLPEPTGEQKKGVQNNLAFEGLAGSPNGKEWLVATEAPLKQDPLGAVRFLLYGMPEAWVLKVQKEYLYPYVQTTQEPKAWMQFQKGISEVQFLDESRVLVLERALQITQQGPGFQIQIYETDLKNPDKNQILPRKLVLDLETLTSQIGKVENFEGMTKGPILSDGRKTLILVSDDNFMRDQRTQFLLFAIKE